MGLPLLGLSTPSEFPSAPATGLDALGDSAELHFGGSAARYSNADWEREQRAEPTCYATCYPAVSGGESVLRVSLGKLFGQPFASGQTD